MPSTEIVTVVSGRKQQADQYKILQNELLALCVPAINSWLQEGFIERTRGEEVDPLTGFAYYTLDVNESVVQLRTSIPNVDPMTFSVRTNLNLGTAFLEVTSPVLVQPSIRLKTNQAQDAMLEYLGLHGFREHLALHVLLDRYERKVFGLPDSPTG